MFFDINKCYAFRHDKLFYRKGEYGIFIGEEVARGRGIGTAAAKLMMQYAFEELKLNRLQLEVFSHNPRGIKAYEKAGFTIEGALRQSLYINNKYSDEIIMGILREEYDKMKENFSFIEVI